MPAETVKTYVFKPAKLSVFSASKKGKSRGKKGSGKSSGKAPK